MSPLENFIWKSFGVSGAIRSLRKPNPYFFLSDCRAKAEWSCIPTVLGHANLANLATSFGRTTTLLYIAPLGSNANPCRFLSNCLAKAEWSYISALLDMANSANLATSFVRGTALFYIASSWAIREPA